MDITESDSIIEADPHKDFVVDKRGHLENRTTVLFCFIAAAVGIGNFWRFPLLALKHGGGTLLIPYLILQLVIGIPVLFMELSIAQFSGLGPTGVWRMVPAWKGVGVATVLIALVTNTWYTVPLAYSIYYMFASAQYYLPWTQCLESWTKDMCYSEFSAINVPICNNQTHDTLCLCSHELYDFNKSHSCYPNVTTNYTDLIKLSKVQTCKGLVKCSTETLDPEGFYFHLVVQQMHKAVSVHDLSTPIWYLVYCLLVAWLIIYACLIKGIYSESKVVYFTVLFPYVVLASLAIIVFFEAGALDGILLFIIPKWSELLTITTWIEAGQQVFFSIGLAIGIMTTTGSYAYFSDRLVRETVYVSAVDTLSSVAAGLVLFGALGTQALRKGISVKKYVEQQPKDFGIVFATYPYILSNLKTPNMWTVLFMFMVFVLGVDNSVFMAECVTTTLWDEFPILHKHFMYVTAIVCFSLFLCNLPFVCPGGSDIIILLTEDGEGLSLLFVGLLEVIGVAWIYGQKRFFRDVKTMFGKRITCKTYWKITIVALAPMCLFIMCCSKVATINTVTYLEHYWIANVYPVLTVVPIVGFMILAICTQPEKNVLKKIKMAFSPSPLWQPQEPKAVNNYMVTAPSIKRFSRRGFNDPENEDEQNVPQLKTIIKRSQSLVSKPSVCVDFSPYSSMRSSTSKLVKNKVIHSSLKKNKVTPIKSVTSCPHTPKTESGDGLHLIDPYKHNSVSPSSLHSPKHATYNPTEQYHTPDPLKTLERMLTSPNIHRPHSPRDSITCSDSQGYGATVESSSNTRNLCKRRRSNTSNGDRHSKDKQANGKYGEDYYKKTSDWSKTTLSIVEELPLVKSEPAENNPFMVYPKKVAPGKIVNLADVTPDYSALKKNNKDESRTSLNIPRLSDEVSKQGNSFKIPAVTSVDIISTPTLSVKTVLPITSNIKDSSITSHHEPLGRSNALSPIQQDSSKNMTLHDLVKRLITEKQEKETHIHSKDSSSFSRNKITEQKQFMTIPSDTFDVRTASEYKLTPCPLKRQELALEHHRRRKESIKFDNISLVHSPVITRADIEKRNLERSGHRNDRDKSAASTSDVYVKQKNKEVLKNMSKQILPNVKSHKEGSAEHSRHDDEVDEAFLKKVQNVERLFKSLPRVHDKHHSSRMNRDDGDQTKHMPDRRHGAMTSISCDHPVAIRSSIRERSRNQVRRHKSLEETADQRDKRRRHHHNHRHHCHHRRSHEHCKYGSSYPNYHSKQNGWRHHSQSSDPSHHRHHENHSQHSRDTNIFSSNLGMKENEQSNNPTRK